MSRTRSIAGTGLITARSLWRLRRLSKQNPAIATTIRRVRREHLTYVPLGGLLDLAEAVAENERAGVTGGIVEAGTALGGSAIVIAAAKDPGRPMTLYDTFGTIPPPTDKDGADVQERYKEIASGDSVGIGGDLYYGYRKNLLEEVTQSFDRLGVACDENSVELVPGRFEDTMLVTDTVSLAHIDCDWYESVRQCLDAIAPQLVVGGRFVIDDYDDWSGCALAVDEFLSGNASKFDVVRRTRLHLIRTT